MKTLKAFGKRFEVGTGEKGQKPWSFEERPGGWWIATHPVTGARKKVALVVRGTKVSFSIDGVLWQGDVQEASAGGATAALEQDFTAQFPGKVRKVLVKDGQAVNEGDTLLLIEAMKMEFTLRAEQAGTVTQVRVQEGQQLSPGDRLLDFATLAAKR